MLEFHQIERGAAEAVLVFEGRDLAEAWPS